LGEARSPRAASPFLFQIRKSLRLWKRSEYKTKKENTMKKIFVGFSIKSNDVMLFWWQEGLDIRAEFENIVELEVDKKDFEALKAAAELLNKQQLTELETDQASIIHRDGSALLSVIIPVWIVQALKKAGKVI
jgi:uncharacterized protein with NRDE domain